MPESTVLSINAFFVKINLYLIFGLQAVVLEGNYWKRRIEVVMKEYNKWRIYYKKRVRYIECLTFLDVDG